MLWCVRVEQLPLRSQVLLGPHGIHTCFLRPLISKCSLGWKPFPLGSAPSPCTRSPHTLPEYIPNDAREGGFLQQDNLTDLWNRESSPFPLE